MPNRLSKMFYENIFYSCLEKSEWFDHTIDWLYSINRICVKIREYSGSNSAIDFYEKAYNFIFSIFPNINDLYSTVFRQMVHLYCDILIESHARDQAEVLIKDVLEKTATNAILTSEMADEKYVLRAIMYNRRYVAYNNAAQTQEVIQKRKTYMEESRNNIHLIANKQKKRLVQYLNDSDEGYNFYGYLKDKKQLFKTWDNCIEDIPSKAPEKTMNYYRKLIQYDLINKDHESMIAHIAQGREYLNNGLYSHEPMIFNSFFMMAEIMDSLQHSPHREHYYIQKSIEDVIQIQLMLNTGKMGDILLLKGVDAYYDSSIEGVFYSFLQALIEYNKKQTSRYWIKIALLLENIHLSFSVLNIYSAGYDVSFLPEDYRTPLTETQIKTFQVSGIQQTSDGKMNLPLI